MQLVQCSGPRRQALGHGTSRRNRDPVGITRRDGTEGREATEEGVGRRGGGSVRHSEQKTTVGPMPEPYSRASLSGRDKPRPAACCKATPLQGRCGPSVRAIRGERIVRAVLDEEACTRELVGAMSLRRDAKDHARGVEDRNARTWTNTEGQCRRVARGKLRTRGRCGGRHRPGAIRMINPEQPAHASSVRVAPIGMLNGMRTSGWSHPKRSLTIGIGDPHSLGLNQGMQSV